MGKEPMARKKNKKGVRKNVTPKSKPKVSGQF